MALKFLQVEISRRVFADVTVAVDDKDPQFEDLFDQDGKIRLGADWRSLTPTIQAAIRDKYDSEWEVVHEEEPEIEGLKIESKEEALKYKTFDASTGKWLN